MKEPEGGSSATSRMQAAAQQTPQKKNRNTAKKRKERRNNKTSFSLEFLNLEFSHNGFGDGPQRPSPSSSVSSLFSSKGNQGALDANLALASLLTVAFACFGTLASTFGSCLIFLIKHITGN